MESFIEFPFQNSVNILLSAVDWISFTWHSWSHMVNITDYKAPRYELLYPFHLSILPSDIQIILQRPQFRHVLYMRQGSHEGKRYVCLTGCVVAVHSTIWPTTSSNDETRSATTFLYHCFSTSVRPLPGKLFFHKTRARSKQIYS